MAKTKVNSVLPNLFPTKFQFRGNKMYYIDDDGNEHKVLKCVIVANGLRDLCIAWEGPGMNDVTIKKTVDVEKECILWIPQHDLFWVNFEPPYNTCHSMILEITTDLAGLVSEVVRRFHGEKGSAYHMCGGEQY